ncbi:MAG: MmcQ/YjbR family DNA-binding protein [Dehalococcoidia bacterium]
MALALPEAEERETWGEATFRVRDKIFAMLHAETANVKASLEAQQALVASEPATFSIAPYTGRYGWVSIRLASVDPDELRELLEEAWRRTAPKRLRDQSLQSGS